MMDVITEQKLKWNDLLLYLQGKKSISVADEKSTITLHADTKKMLDGYLEAWKNEVCQMIQKAKPKLIEHGELVREQQTKNIDEGWLNLLNQMNAQCSKANEKFINSLETHSKRLDKNEQKNLQQVVLTLIPKMNQAYTNALDGIANAFGDIFSSANSVVTVLSDAVNDAISVITGLFG
ncbi:hypothetical protein [Thalassotalea fusca]